MGMQGSVLEKLGKTGRAFKLLLELGSTLADLDPSGGAKVAFTICTKAWQRLEENDKLKMDLEDFVDNLADIVPSIEDVRGLAGVHLAEATDAMMNLIEDISLFIINFKSEDTWARVLYSTVDSAPQDQMQIFIDKFKRVRKGFNTRLTVQVLGSVEAEIIRSKLKPVPQAGYDPTQTCMPGTRVDIIQDIMAYLEDTAEQKRFIWVYGLAGLGKSFIAASLCQQLEEQGILGASFFCKRDNLHLHDPCRLLTTVAYSLAVRCKPYGDAIAALVRTDLELHLQHIQPMYNSLFAMPIRSISEAERPKTEFIIVIDALDECGDAESRKQLLACFEDMSRTITWLKVVLTSRPEGDIQECFGQASTEWFSSFNVLNYDAHLDVRVFIQAQLSRLEQHDGWPQDAVDRLCKLSSGLFIWARTACKFIIDAHNPKRRLEKVLDGTHSDDSLARLNALYATAVRTGAVDNEEDNLEDIRQFLGLIASMATRTPLPIPSLFQLLRGRISRYSLDHMLNSLSSVLYLDPKHGGAIRFSHPSFMDYIKDVNRSRELCVNLDEQNAMIAECCLETMIEGLRFNICDLETSDIRNQDISDLIIRVQNCIEPDLQYSYSELLEAFLFNPTLLYWIEALSLLKKLNVAPSSMLELNDTNTIHDECRAYARDVYRFILAFYDAISTSTPHLYISALPLAPDKSRFAKRMRPLFPNTYSITEGAELDWSPCMRTILVGSRINSVAWSLDGRRIATGLDDGNVQLWDPKTGITLLEPMRGHSGIVRSVAFSPNGRQLVSGSDDNSVIVWDADTGAILAGPLCEHKAGVRSVRFSPNNVLIASGSHDQSVLLWDAKEGIVLRTLNGHSGTVFSVAFSSDGRRLASGSGDCSIRIWDTNAGTALIQPLTGHSAWIFSVDFSSSDNYIVSGSDDSTIRIWDTATGNTLLVLQEHSEPVLSVLFSPDDCFLFSSSDDGTVRVWDAKTGTQISSLLLGHVGVVRSIARSPDGRRIVSGSYDETLRIWDIGAIDVGNKVPQGHSDRVWCVSFSPDGRRVASSSHDKTIRVWDTESGTAVLDPIRGHHDGVLSVTYSPDGKRIVSGSMDYTVRVWDAQTGAEIFKLLHGVMDWVWSTAFSPDNRTIASASRNGTIRLWESSTGESRFEITQGHVTPVYSVAFSPDSRRLVSGSADRSMRIWDTETGNMIFQVTKGHRWAVLSVAFSTDGSYIASGSDYSVRRWDAATGVPLLEPLKVSSDGVYCISFSPDGHSFLSLSSDNAIRIWDAENSTLTFELSGAILLISTTSGNILLRFHPMVGILLPAVTTIRYEYGIPTRAHT
ncbi:hypothetical protein RhiJN_21364 [Ceratobasidium sp. AG-Ba]|nr:hypothetical protein RhiJN_21364 [Ceratobasidium sp. AG-Ba]